MVFESVVVDVLNRFLGDYVVNLDSSQLKLGIWGGNVTLTIKCYNLQDNGHTIFTALQYEVIFDSPGPFPNLLRKSHFGTSIEVP